MTKAPRQVQDQPNNGLSNEQYATPPWAQLTETMTAVQTDMATKSEIEKLEKKITKLDKDYTESNALLCDEIEGAQEDINGIKAELEELNNPKGWRRAGRITQNVLPYAISIGSGIYAYNASKSHTDRAMNDYVYPLHQRMDDLTRK